MDKTQIGTLAMQVNLWASLGYGLMLLLVPDVFCDLLKAEAVNTCLLYTSPSPRDATLSRMPSSA